MAKKKPPTPAPPKEETALVPAPGVVLRALPLPERPRDPVKAYLGRLAPGSYPAQHSALRLAGRVLTGDATREPEEVPWEHLRHEHTGGLPQALLALDLCPGTVNRILCAVRGVLRAAWRLGLLDRDAMERACDVPALRHEVLPSGRALPLEDLAALYDACAADPTPEKGARDAAILALCYPSGMRRAEVVTIDMDHLTVRPAQAELRIVRGKGRKERTAYLKGNGLDALRAWFAIRGDAPGPLVCHVRRGGRVYPGRRLSDEGLAKMLAQRAKEAGIGRTTPHDLRRTSVSDLLSAGVDISVVAGLVGHADLKTTRRYDRRGEAPKHDAVGRVAVPYGKKG